MRHARRPYLPPHAILPPLPGRPSPAACRVPEDEQWASPIEPRGGVSPPVTFVPGTPGYHGRAQARSRKPAATQADVLVRGDGQRITSMVVRRQHDHAPGRPPIRPAVSDAYCKVLSASRTATAARNRAQCFRTIDRGLPLTIRSRISWMRDIRSSATDFLDHATSDHGFMFSRRHPALKRESSHRQRGWVRASRSATRSSSTSRASTAAVGAIPRSAGRHL